MFTKLFSVVIAKTTLVLISGVGALLGLHAIIEYKTRRKVNGLSFPGPKPLPLIGNFLSVMRNGMHSNDLALMREYGKTCTYYEGTQPVILTNDVKLIKCILIRDFNSFVNRRSFDSFLIEPMDKFMNLLKNDEWKHVRSIVTTTFTTVKLKKMSHHMLNCIKNYEAYLKEQVEKDGIITAKTFFESYSLDVISSCCFGIDTNSIRDPNNEFLANLQIIFSEGFSRNPKLILTFMAPSLAGFLARNGIMEFFPMKPLNFLKEVTNSIIERRRAKMDVRDDFIQCMIENEEISNNDYTNNTTSMKKLQDSSFKKSLTNKEIISQAILFLAAGYESTSATLEFISYNLAKHPHIQDSLISEIDSALEKHKGEVNYNSVVEMKYMDMVIDETLRMYPPAARLDRVASNDYTYNGIEIKKGQTVVVPLYALHHDSDLYPDPEQFDPERFSDASKKTRESVSFLPFGAGPRNCVGMRFALIEIKLLLASILSKYRFVPCSQTPESIVLDKTALTRSSKPILLKIEKRL